MALLIRNGWEIAFHKQLFGRQRTELREKAHQLKASLSKEEYISHPDVKLLATLMACIKEKIVLDPYASHFALTGPLRKYCRLKKMGLNERYRLFFRAFDQGERKVIVIIWLGYPRKEGDKKDCYAVFSKMVANGDFPEDMNQLLAECE